MTGTRFGLTRVAFGCSDIGMIQARIAAFRIGHGRSAHVPISSRRVPRRDLSGGRLFWIIGHRLVARQAIAGVDERPPSDGGGAIIRLHAELVAVRTTMFRAHQGWRYIDEADWPADLADGDGDGDAALPPSLAAELDALHLI